MSLPGTHVRVVLDFAGTKHCPIAHANGACGLHKAGVKLHLTSCAVATAFAALHYICIAASLSDHCYICCHTSSCVFRAARHRRCFSLRTAMARTEVPCALLLLSLLAAPSFVRALQFRPSAARRLLHDAPESNSGSVSSTSYLDALQARGVTAAEQLDYVLGLPVAGALNEENINALLQDVQG